VTTSFAAPVSSTISSEPNPLPRRQKGLALIVIGTGRIGSELLNQIAVHPRALGGELRVCAIANSRRWIWKRNGLNLRPWTLQIRRSSVRTDLDELIQRTRDLRDVTVAVVDCTASSAVVDAYTRFVEAGAHIVTPNKKANVLPWARYRLLLQSFAQCDRRFLFGPTVGGGLPVLSTLSTLLSTGDTVRAIEGVFSGTLSYLFNRYDGSRPFSALVREAHQLGFTEPDPRVDLSGSDVASKLLVLARQMGIPSELNDICVEDLSTPCLDADIARRFKSVSRDGAVLRYVGRIRDRTISARLESLPRSHPFANTRHADNIVAFHTRRYSETPLVIQGPGAGPEVTAAGVVSELLRLLQS
jgi:bifunctional aspartokinase / homoserine dehydrogenase 1